MLDIIIIVILGYFALYALIAILGGIMIVFTSTGVMKNLIVITLICGLLSLIGYLFC